MHYHDFAFKNVMSAWIYRIVYLHDCSPLFSFLLVLSAASIWCLYIKKSIMFKRSYCLISFSIAGDMPKVWIINKDLKKLYNASSGVEKEEKNQQTWLAWYIKRQNNRGIHWFFIKRPNSWQTPIIHLCITFVRGPLSVFTLATADPLRLHVFH